jgi:hypothetical protein
LSTKLSKILLPVSRQGTTDSCRQAAFGLARDFAARLEVLHLCPAAWQRLPYASEISPFYSEEVLDICREQVSAEQLEVKAWFEQALSAQPGAPADFQCIEGFPATNMAARTRVADLSVVPSIAARDDEFWTAVRDAALFQSGRPVLVVPQDAEPIWRNDRRGLEGQCGVRRDGGGAVPRQGQAHRAALRRRRRQ